VRERVYTWPMAVVVGGGLVLGGILRALFPLYGA
jgi:hypothetical protein